MTYLKHQYSLFKIVQFFFEEISGILDHILSSYSAVYIVYICECVDIVYLFIAGQRTGCWWMMWVSCSNCHQLGLPNRTPVTGGTGALMWQAGVEGDNRHVQRETEVYWVWVDYTEYDRSVLSITGMHWVWQECTEYDRSRGRLKVGKGWQEKGEMSILSETRVYWVLQEGELWQEKGERSILNVTGVNKWWEEDT